MKEEEKERRRYYDQGEKGDRIKEKEEGEEEEK